MKEIFDFISNIGKLKADGRRGWILHEVDNPETTASHAFQVAMLVWTVGKNKDIEFTKEDVENLEPVKGRPTHKQRSKMEKVKKEMEKEAMDKLTEDLPEE